MTKNRERLILWIVLEMVFIALVFIGSKYDFNITYALSGVTVNSDGALVSNVSFIAKALEVIGEWPAFIFVSFASFIIVRNLKKIVKKSTPALIFIVLFYAAVVAMMFRGWHESFKDVLGSVRGIHYIAIVPLTIAFVILIRFAVSKVDRQKVKRFFIPAVVTVITAAIVLVCLSAIKIGWGRVRMREIIAANDPTLFTSWFVPNWFSGAKSFPSGHTGYTTLLFLIPIWFEGKNADKRRRLTYLGIGAFVLILAFSRLCAAAHYLTDVTFGFAISFIIVQIATVKFEKSFMRKPVPKFIRTTEITTENIPHAKTEPAPQTAGDAARLQTEQNAQAEKTAEFRAQAEKPSPAPTAAKKEPPKRQAQRNPQEAAEGTKFVPISQLKGKKKRKSLREILGLDKKKTVKPADSKKQAAEPKKQSPVRDARSDPGPAPETEAKPVVKPAPKAPQASVEKPSQSAAAENAATAMAARRNEVQKESENDAPAPTLTSFSLEQARAEKAQREAAIVARNEAEAKKIDESMKLAVEGKSKDISVPVEPKQKSAQKNTVKRKAPSKPGARKKTAPSDDSAVQMHFKFDSESNTLTSDISDD